MSRSKAYFINGGAGRVICSIPAFEKLAETDKDFIIVCEGNSEIFRGHPTLDSRVFDHWHKGLFQTYLKDRELISPEPYRVWEYYNQKCSLSQAFDIIINNAGIRNLPAPTLNLSKSEISQAYSIIQEIKAKSGLDKILVFQPFGRGIQHNNGMIVDPSSRSFAIQDVIDIIDELKNQYAIIIMSEIPLQLDYLNSNNKLSVAQPMIPNIRIWAAVIELSNHFLGCDSVGQHMARALDKTATVVTGSTFPINISYINDKKFDIIDIGKNRRTYSPIRISVEDQIDRSNDLCMEMSNDQRKEILKSVKSRLGKSTKSNIVYIDPSKSAIPESDDRDIPNFKKNILSEEISKAGIVDNTVEASYTVVCSN